VEYGQFGAWEKTLNLRGVKFPISIHSIKKFVRLNEDLNIKINILFRTLSGEVFPFECGIGNGDVIINLLMIENSKKIADRWLSENHFLAIKNVNRYLSSQYQIAGQKKKSYSRSYFCVNCFNKFSLPSSLKNMKQRVS